VKLQTSDSISITSAHVTLRTATSADIPALVPLINDAYDFTEHHIFPNSRRTDRHDITAYIDEMTVVELEGRVVACVHIDLKSDPAHYGLLAVEVGLQRSGLGSMLVRYAEDRALAAGRSQIGIETVKQAGLVPFYDARGYRVVQEHDGQTWNGGADWGASGPWQMVDMVKDLR
jgi:N-acetylglutamate synthase-like GNAT family acetyltransferase